MFRTCDHQSVRPQTIFALLLLIASCVFISSPVESSASVRSASGSIYQCTPSLACDIINATTPSVDYTSTCPRVACDITAIMDWENTSLPSPPPSIAQAHVAYVTNPAKANAGLRGLSALLNRWMRFPIAGHTVSAVKRFLPTKPMVENAIFSSGSLIALLHSRTLVTIANERYQGFVTVVVPGFNPVGPLVVLNGNLIQMTWSQWREQSMGAWSVVAQSAKPVTVGTTNAATVTISFNPNGGTGSMSDDVALASAPIVLPPNTFVLLGEVFNGWNTMAGGGGESYANSSTHSFAQSTVLYAQWSPQSILVENTTNNWSGYVATGVTASNASGSWVVPSLTCNGTTSTNSSTWVGIGGWSVNGVSSGDLLQTGVEDSCNGGVQIDTAWWQDWPDTPYTMNFSMLISPGDSMSGAVFKTSSGNWETVLSDNTTGVSGIVMIGGSWGTTPIVNGTSSVLSPVGKSPVTYGGGTSAEWVVEDMMGATSLMTFANYGSVTFSNLEMNSSPWYPHNVDSVMMLQNGVVLSMPTKVDANGFTMSYQG